jgi:hypothetical protein
MSERVTIAIFSQLGTKSPLPPLKPLARKTDEGDMDWLLVGLLVAIFMTIGLIRLLAWYLTKRPADNRN